MGTEREITSTVELCRPDGHLNPAAVGWSRGPLHGTRLRRTPLRGWGRTKRWEYWGVVTPTHVITLTVADLDYAAQHQVWLLDRRTSEEIDTTVVVPLGAGCSLPDSSAAGPSRAHARRRGPCPVMPAA